jgi:hypothetical protein
LPPSATRRVLGATGEPPPSLHPMRFPVQLFSPVRWVMQPAVTQAWPLDRRSPALFPSPQVYAGAGTPRYHAAWDTMLPGSAARRVTLAMRW